jgi:hypothetical protein
MSAQEMIFPIRLDDGSIAEARTWDPESAKTFRKLIEDPTYGRELRVRAVEPPDTMGHALAEDTITVIVRQEDDLEGHTMSLHFPSAEDAKRFQKRLIISGALAASLVVGVGGAQLATHQTVAPAAAPAITAPAVRAPAPLDSMKPGNIDARLRDGSAVSGGGSITAPTAPRAGDIDAQLRDGSAISGTGTSSIVSPAKDAKDDQASGINATGSGTSSIVSPAKDAKDDLASGIGGTDDSSQAGNRGVMPQ